jgi:transcriptional regulator GlxA family with amidase domain
MKENLDLHCQFGIQLPARAARHVVRHVGVALFDGFELSDVTVVVEVFHAANELSESLLGGRVRYELDLLAYGGRVSSSSSVVVLNGKNSGVLRTDNYCVMFISGRGGVDSDLCDERVLSWLRNVTQRSDLVFPIVDGRLSLEAAGAPLRHTQVPRIELASFRSRGFPERSRPTHAALAVVESDLGGEIARQIANRIEPTLETQFTEIIRKPTALQVSDGIQASARWIELNCNRAVTIDEAAQVAGMSGRTFLRRFRLEIGVVPSDYLLSVRLHLCCRLLSDTNLPVDKVARRCGISSGGQLSKIFRKHVGMTPSEYRATRLRSIVAC